MIVLDAYSPDLAQWKCLVLPVVVDAEDALIAALKVKMQRPEALIAKCPSAKQTRRYPPPLTFSICRVDFGSERPKTPTMIPQVRTQTICIFIPEGLIHTIVRPHVPPAMAA